MPRKVRDLIAELKRAGFVNRGGKGSHRNFTHPKVVKAITLSGKEGDDALPYQEKAVKLALQESKPMTFDPYCPCADGLRFNRLANG